MAVTYQNEVAGKKDISEILKGMAETVQLNPLGQGNIDPMDVYNPHPSKYEMGWADPDKLERKLQQGCLIVPATDAKKYKVALRECVNGTIMRRGMVLIARPRMSREIKTNLMVLTAYRMSGTKIDTFNSWADNTRGKSDADERDLVEMEAAVEKKGAAATKRKLIENPGVNALLEARGETAPLDEDDE